MAKRIVSSFQMTEADAHKFDALEAAGFGSRTDIIRTALDRMYIQEVGSMRSKYPVGHKFSGVVNRVWEDTPAQLEELEVIGHFVDKVSHESGVIARAADGIETEIPYGLLREDGLGL